VTGQVTGQRAVTGHVTGHVRRDRFHALTPTRACTQAQRQKTVTAGGSVELPGELVEKVLETVAGCWAEGTPGWRLGVPLAAVQLVC
jgi:hypothetical protein